MIWGLKMKKNEKVKGGGIEFPTKRYMMGMNLRPAKDVLGKIRTEYEEGPGGEEKISVVRESDGIAYFKVLVRELAGIIPESHYPTLMKELTKRLGYGEEPKLMFYEQHLGNTGLFAIAEEPKKKCISFFYTYCTNARKGNIEGTNVLVGSGLGIIPTVAIISSLRVKKVA